MYELNGKPVYEMNGKPVYEMNEAFAFVCYSKTEYLSVGRRYSVVAPLTGFLQLKTLQI